MANRAERLVVFVGDWAELERRVRSQTGHARDAKRAVIVLRAAEVRTGMESADLVACRSRR